MLFLPTQVLPNPARGPQFQYLASDSSSLAGRQKIPLTRGLDWNSACDLARIPAEHLALAKRSCVGLMDTSFENWWTTVRKLYCGDGLT